MKVLHSGEARLPAQENRRSPAFEKGHADGVDRRARGDAPGNFVRIGIDAYSLGFRAGYFEREDPGSERPGHPGAPGKMPRQVGLTAAIQAIALDPASPPETRHPLALTQPRAVNARGAAR